MNDEELIAPKISTAAIEMLALECDDEAREWASMQLEPMFERIAASLRALAAERDAHAAEIERLKAALQTAVRVVEEAARRRGEAEAELARLIQKQGGGDA